MALKIFDASVKLRRVNRGGIGYAQPNELVLAAVVKPLINQIADALH